LLFFSFGGILLAKLRDLKKSFAPVIGLLSFGKHCSSKRSWKKQLHNCDKSHISTKNYWENMSWRGDLMFMRQKDRSEYPWNIGPSSSPTFFTPKIYSGMQKSKILDPIQGEKSKASWACRVINILEISLKSSD
jgi:hypothetical protein